MKRLATMLILALALFVTTAAAQSPNSTGTWDATLTSPQGTFNVQMMLKQDGEKVTGVVKGQRGEIPIEGTLTGKDLKLKYTIKFQDNDMLITLAGTLDGASIKGSADYGGLAQGDFTAQRAGEAAATAKAPAPAATAAPAGDKIDITGPWNFQVETPAGSGTPTFTFKQEGEKLTGQYKGAFGEAPLTGSVKGNKVDWSIKISVQGQDATIKYSGTVEKDGTMKGTADLGEIGSATWTAKRQ
ncbi:MAG TPA: hypothetical protein VKB46_24930 [Pyrinomonadaceae bacterium]|nr:hypothetical protein [Pyrinomonadaceae bacterium]